MTFSEAARKKFLPSSSGPTPKRGGGGGPDTEGTEFFLNLKKFEIVFNMTCFSLNACSELPSYIRLKIYLFLF